MWTQCNTRDHETFIWQLRGASTVQVGDVTLANSAADAVA